MKAQKQQPPSTLRRSTRLRSQRDASQPLRSQRDASQPPPPPTSSSAAIPSPNVQASSSETSLTTTTRKAHCLTLVAAAEPGRDDDVDDEEPSSLQQQRAASQNNDENANPNRKLKKTGKRPATNKASSASSKRARSVSNAVVVVVAGRATAQSSSITQQPKVTPSPRATLAFKSLASSNEASSSSAPSSLSSSSSSEEISSSNRGVPDIFQSTTTPPLGASYCRCLENHCSEETTTLNYWATYGRDYLETLQDREGTMVILDNDDEESQNNAPATSSQSTTATSSSNATHPRQGRQGCHSPAVGSLEARSSSSSTTRTPRYSYYRQRQPSLAASIHDNDDDDDLLLQHNRTQSLEHQPHLTSEMREILVDWLIELAEEYHLKASTLHLAVALVDRSLLLQGGNSSTTTTGSHHDGEEGAVVVVPGSQSSSSSFSTGALVVPREKLQCLGCACMLMACKLEEIRHPSVQDFAYISDSSYTEREITEMELSVCTFFQFRLQTVTPHNFLYAFVRASNASGCCGCSTACRCVDKKDVKLEFLVQYLMELSLLPYELRQQTQPSLVAAAVVYLARATLGYRAPLRPYHHSGDSVSSSSSSSTEERAAAQGFWSLTLEHYTGYNLYDLEETVLILHRYQRNAEVADLRAVYQKYKGPRFGRIALKTVLNKEDLGFY